MVKVVLCFGPAARNSNLELTLMDTYVSISQNVGEMTHVHLLKYAIKANSMTMLCK